MGNVVSTEVEGLGIIHIIFSLSIALCMNEHDMLHDALCELIPQMYRRACACLVSA